ncbi:MAG: thiamine pyrophosphate-binding protein [Armatimonadaceae bacterium]
MTMPKTASRMNALNTTPAAMPTTLRTGGQITIGSYLLDRLYGLGLRHIFGIPGDYILGLYDLIEKSPIESIISTNENCAGFAADGYARVKGIGCCCVTYCVGGLSALNPIACAYAERSPVILLSGSPGRDERLRNPLLHHMVRDFSTQWEVFEKVTEAAVVLDDPLTAQREIDRTLDILMRYKRPVYIEVPRDMVHVPLRGESAPLPVPAIETDRDALQDAIDEVRQMLRAAKKPVILAGMEIHRFGLQESLLRIVERFNVPVASTLLGKSVVQEDHPLSVGVYGGMVGRDEVQEFVDDADCVLMLGSILTDIDIGAYASVLDESRTIHATAGKLAVRRHRYMNVPFEVFVRALSDAPEMPRFENRELPKPHYAFTQRPADSDAVTLQGMFGHIDSLLNEKMIVVADVGESLFASTDLRVRERTEFLSPAYYTSMGFAVPASIGTRFAAPELRPLVLVGDGAFQMTGMELANAVRHNLAPIVVILNNRGYSTEREIMEGPFNDIHNWQYDRIVDLLRGGVGHVVKTHGEFVQAMDQALKNTGEMHVLNVLLDPSDRSPAMTRLARRLAERLAPTHENVTPDNLPADEVSPTDNAALN